MSDQGSGEFKFIAASGEELNSCENYSGEATVEYSNGDTFKGSFNEGVTL